MITVYDDAPEENNEYAEPQTCEGDGIRLYFRAVGEPLGVRVARNKKRLSLEDNLIFLVEAAGLEPTVSSTRTNTPSFFDYFC